MSKKLAKIETTMTSIELVALINDMREDGAAELRHTDFTAKIRKVLGNEAEKFSAPLKMPSGQKAQGYKLPEREAHLMVMSESYKVQAAVYDRMKALENAWVEAEKNRQDLRIEYRPMTDALKAERAAQGKETSFFHYTNENDMIYRIAFGATSKQLKKVLDDGSLRDVLTPLQRKCVLAMQRANTVFIEEGNSFEERKERLTKLFKKKFENELYEEHIRIAA